MLRVFDMNTQMSERRLQGMTLLESLVVMVLLAILVALMAPAFCRAHQHSGISCVNNLKQIGTAYRIWENDNGGKYPMVQAEASGGMQGMVSNSIAAGRYAYLPYAIMQYELGQSPKVVLCPSDERSPNTNFYWGRQNAPKGERLCLD